MTAILPGQDPRIAQIFQDMASNKRTLKDADEVEQAGKRGQAAMHTEYQMRAEDGITVKEGMGVGDINLTAQRYRQQAADMRVAIAKLRDEDPDHADYATTVAMQILGQVSTGDTMADTILMSIVGGDATDDTFLSAKFAMPDAVGTAGADEVSVETDGMIFGVKTGDGADVVSLSGAQVFDVSTDATPTIAVTVADTEGSTTWMSTQTFANNDRLTIQAETAGSISTGGGDDSLRIDADNLYSVSAGDGNDRLRISADYAKGINAGAGNDIISLHATIAERISGGDGADAIDVTAARGSVDGGEGDDLIRISATEAVTVSGGRGNDMIEVRNGGGTVTLSRNDGDGDDIAMLAPGANLTIASAAPTSITREGDKLLLRYADGGSLTLSGIDQAGEISLVNARGGDPVPLQIPPADANGVDLRV